MNHGFSGFFGGWPRRAKPPPPPPEKIPVILESRSSEESKKHESALGRVVGPRPMDAPRGAASTLGSTVPVFQPAQGPSGPPVIRPIVIIDKDQPVRMDSKVEFMPWVSGTGRTRAGSPAATVVVPTHDHGETLFRSVPTALGQTVRDVEILIVGDGMTEETKRVAEALAERDPRIRVFANPKGRRHGEDHRHRALEGARGAVVCYLADDDLWLPDHVETMLGLLEGADFAHTLPVRALPDGGIFVWSCDLGMEEFRRLLLSGQNRAPFVCAGHTLAAYHRLPQGWAQAPEDVPTDLAMWQKFLREPWCRAVSSGRPTTVCLDSPMRPGWTIARRCAELDLWKVRLEGDERRRSLVYEILEAQARLRARTEFHGAQV